MDGGWMPLPTHPQRYCDPTSLVFQMQLSAKLRKAGIIPLLRDATMEEHAALVSYTEFESWWSSIYESRDQLKAFETPHVHEDVSKATGWIRQRAHEANI